MMYVASNTIGFLKLTVPTDTNAWYMQGTGFYQEA
jgi:hypothetical protein